MSSFACLLVPGSVIHSVSWQTICSYPQTLHPSAKCHPSWTCCISCWGRAAIWWQGGWAYWMTSRANILLRRLMCLQEDRRGWEVWLWKFFWSLLFYRQSIQQVIYFLKRWLVFLRHRVSSWLCKGKRLWPVSAWSSKGLESSYPLCQQSINMKIKYLFSVHLSLFH